MKALDELIENEEAKWNGETLPHPSGSTSQVKRLRAARAELERLRVENHEETAHVEKLRDILTRTANALKGEPALLTQHSWHDLAEVAAKLRAKVAAGDALVSRLETLFVGTETQKLIAAYREAKP